jgi:hypothetical protein
MMWQVNILTKLRGCLFRLILAFHWKKQADQTKRYALAVDFTEASEQNGEFYFLPLFTWYFYELPLFTLFSIFCHFLLCQLIIFPFTLFSFLLRI